MTSNNVVPALIDRCTNLDSVKLTPISSLEGLCPGKATMFFCQINNSSVLAWSSEEYVHDLLSFTVRDMPGLTRMDQVFMDTVGLYNGSEIDNGTIISGRSLLIIKPRADTPNATITCHNEDNGCSSSITFHLLGTYHRMIF